MNKFSQPILGILGTSTKETCSIFSEPGLIIIIIIKDLTKGDGLPPFPDQQPRPALDLLTPVKDSRNFPTTPFIEICFKILFLPSHLC